MVLNMVEDMIVVCVGLLCSCCVVWIVSLISDVLLVEVLKSVFRII